MGVLSFPRLANLGRPKAVKPKSKAHEAIEKAYLDSGGPNEKLRRVYAAYAGKRAEKVGPKSN